LFIAVEVLLSEKDDQWPTLREREERGEEQEGREGKGTHFDVTVDVVFLEGGNGTSASDTGKVGVGAEAFPAANEDGVNVGPIKGEEEEDELATSVRGTGDGTGDDRQRDVDSSSLVLLRHDVGAVVPELPVPRCSGENRSRELRRVTRVDSCKYATSQDRFDEEGGCARSYRTISVADPADVEPLEGSNPASVAVNIVRLAGVVAAEGRRRSAWRRSARECGRRARKEKGRMEH
jgi:hypothetical protein